MKTNKSNLQNPIITSSFIKHCQPIFAYLFLPCINLLVLFLANPIEENISYISNTLGYRFVGLLWASSCALYLYIYTTRFAYSLSYNQRIGKWGLQLSTTGMLLSVLIPYVPETLPIVAKLHINLSMFATILYVLVMFHIMIVSYFREPLIISLLLPYYITIVGSCLLLFLLMGCVSTILEVLFVVPMGMFLYACDKKIKKG